MTYFLAVRLRGSHAESEPVRQKKGQNVSSHIDIKVIQKLAAEQVENTRVKLGAIPKQIGMGMGFEVTMAIALVAAQIHQRRGNG